mmetsp:Transcript_13564/g.45957  ORF Transcript_13564/g.45957 Transcript_13564/m.45957 type:complete len:269 (-) Transcript_13564:14-820(-)
MEGLIPLMKEQPLPVLEWFASELAFPNCETEHARRLMELDASYTRAATVDLVNRIPLKRGSRVLELGFGGGNAIVEMAKRCKETGASVVGVDMSINACESTRSALEAAGCDASVVQLRCGSVADFFPFEDGAFDAVYHSNCWYFWADLEFSVSETARVLKPRGLLFTGTKVLYIQALFQDRFHEVATYFKNVSIGEYEAALERANMRDVVTRTVDTGTSRYALTTAKKPRVWAFKPVPGADEDCRAIPEPGSWPPYPFVDGKGPGQEA